MTTKQEREVLLQGKDSMVNGILGFFVERGWVVDRILRNSATKRFEPNQAEIWVELDSENSMYYVKPSYVSCGENVVGLCTLYIKADISAEELENRLGAFIEEVELEINQSFAVRFLGTGAVSKG